MGIGTDDGQYFDDHMSYLVATHGTDKQRSDAAEMAANEKSGDFQSRFQASNVPDNSGIDPSQLRDVGYQKMGFEDRRNQSLPDMISGFVGEQFTKDKFNAIMQHPWAAPWQTMTANLPSKETGIGNTLGLQDIGSKVDYDYEGAKAAGVQPDERGHLPDTYKLPNHMTFSDESKYSNDQTPGGHWEQGEDKKWTFTPSEFNLKQHSAEELKDYFSKYEPDSTLRMPSGSPQMPAGALKPDGLIGPPEDPRNIKIGRSGYRITPEDINTGINVGLSAGPGTLAGKFPKLPPGEPGFGFTKSGHAYEQMPNGTFDVYDKATGKTLWNADTAEEAKNFNPYKQIPIKDADKPESIPVDQKDKFQAYIDMFTQHAANEAKNIQQAEPKLSPKEAFLQSVEDIHGKLMTTLSNIKNKYIQAAKEAPVTASPTEIAMSKGYTEPAFRGVNLYSGHEPNPVYDFYKHGESELYSTASPMLADMYAGGLSSHPGMEVPPGTFGPGSQVMPLYINPKDYHYYNAEGAHWTSANGKAIKEAKTLGKKGVIVDKVYDEPGSTHSLPPKKIYITFPEGAGTVKSWFAKHFDESSPNILHNIPAIGIAGAAGAVSMAPSDENQ